VTRPTAGDPLGVLVERLVAATDRLRSNTINPGPLGDLDAVVRAVDRAAEALRAVVDDPAALVELAAGERLAVEMPAGEACGEVCPEAFDALRAVLSLHKPTEPNSCGDVNCTECGDVNCTECRTWEDYECAGVGWPCPTARAIAEALRGNGVASPDKLSAQ
jgi:hypothetical protein